MVSFVALCFLVRSVFFYYPPSLQRIVTLYHINIAQASVFSNSSYILINATRGRRKMLPERIAAFAWIQSTPVTLLDESLEGKNFSPMWSWAHHQVILWNTIWVRLRSVIEIKVVDAAKSRGVVTPEFCWLFNDTQSLIYAVVSSLQLGYNSWVLLEFTLAWFQHGEVFMDPSVLRSGLCLSCVPCHDHCDFFSDGDGKWGLACRGGPAGPGQDPLEWWTGSVPTDTHWAETEV